MGQFTGKGSSLLGVVDSVGCDGVGCDGGFEGGVSFVILLDLVLFILDSLAGCFLFRVSDMLVI